MALIETSPNWPDLLIQVFLLGKHWDHHFLWTGEEWVVFGGLASASFLDENGCNLDKESFHECNCCLELVSTCIDAQCQIRSGLNSQCGRPSSHFFFRLRHVMQPVLVRLLKLRLRF